MVPRRNVTGRLGVGHNVAMENTFTPFKADDDKRFRSNALLAITAFVTVTLTAAVFFLFL